MNGRNNGYTMIDELPDLDKEQDIEYDRREQPAHLTPAQYQKFIRGSQKLDPESGMVPQRQQNPPPNPQFMPRFISQNSMMTRESPPPSSEESDNLRCIDVARHIQNCPVCQKIYHHDKSAYIIIIIVLVIICLLLLKKVLNV